MSECDPSRIMWHKTDTGAPWSNNSIVPLFRRASYASVLSFFYCIKAVHQRGRGNVQCAWHRLLYFSYRLWTNSVDQNPCWETNNALANREIPHILWSQKVHYRVHKTGQLFRCWATLMQLSHSQPASLRSSEIPHLHRGLLSGFFLSGFPTKPLFASLLSCHMRNLSRSPPFDRTDVWRRV